MPIRRTIAKLKASPSKMLLAILALVFIALFFGFHKWNIRKVVVHDTLSYYSYLPATLLHHDPAMTYLAKDTAKFKHQIAGHRILTKLGEEGRIQKYTMGLAIAYLPFFALGHVSAWMGGAETNGFSQPYMFWIQFSGLFYMFLGLIFLRKLLLRHFSEATTSWTIIGLALGTNLFYYSLDDSPMPHAFMFGFICIFLYACMRFFEEASWKWSLVMGILGAEIVLARPNHLFLWLIPLLYGLSVISSMSARLEFLRSNWKMLLIWPLISLLWAFPQMLYWHVLTGEWIRYSYVGERFFLLSPSFLDAWFSFRKGWLLWTPLAGLGLLGFFFLGKEAKQWRWPLLAFFLPASWLVASWWCWWWGGSFGNRAMIDLCAVLAIPFAASMQWILGRKTILKKALLGLVVVLIALNLFQSLQYNKGLIHWDAMSGKAYFALFGKLKRPGDWEAMMDPPDYEAAKRGEF